MASTHIRRLRVSELDTSVLMSENIDPSDPSEVVALMEQARYSFRWHFTLSQAEKRNPFDRIALTNTTYREQKAAGLSSSGLFSMWYRGRDLNPYRLFAH